MGIPYFSAKSRFEIDVLACRFEFFHSIEKSLHMWYNGLLKGAMLYVRLFFNERTD